MTLRAIWQLTDWAVQARMVYGMKRKLRAIYCSSLDWTVRKLHIARKYMYLLYYIDAMGLKQLLFNYINTLLY